MELLPGSSPESSNPPPNFEEATDMLESLIHESEDFVAISVDTGKANGQFGMTIRLFEKASIPDHGRSNDVGLAGLYLSYMQASSFVPLMYHVFPNPECSADKLRSALEDMCREFGRTVTRFETLSK